MKKFDVVIVGSGLGGLLCGSILSKEGFSVCIVEKNHKIGGSLQTFVHNGVKFDAGVHYIGGFDEGQNLHQLFKYVDLTNKLKVQKLSEEGFDRITFRGDNREYWLAQGYDRYIDRLSIAFPDEKAALHNYVNKIRELCSHFPIYNLKNQKKKVFGEGIVELNARDYIASITSNRKLRNVLAATNPLYAGDPEKTPFYVHALINNSYIESAWRCIGGGSQLTSLLMKSIKNNDGTFRLRSTVRKFTMVGGKVTAAELNNRERIEGKNFISNMHPSVTMKMLEPGSVKRAYRSRIISLENTISSFILNAVVKKGFLKFWDYNRYHYTKSDVWQCHRYTENSWPKGMVIFMSSDPGPEGYAEGLTIMTYMNFRDVKQWESSFNTVSNPGDRGSGYQDFKHTKAEKLIAAAEDVIPGLRENIISYSATTPLTFRDYLGTTDGAIYGIMKDCRNPLKSFVSPRTKIPNLFLAGQNTNLHGILGVTISSIVTCSEFLGSSHLIDKILKA